MVGKFDFVWLRTIVKPFGYQILRCRLLAQVQDSVDVYVRITTFIAGLPACDWRQRSPQQVDLSTVPIVIATDDLAGAVQVQHVVEILDQLESRALIEFLVGVVGEGNV